MRNKILASTKIRKEGDQICIRKSEKAGSVNGQSHLLPLGKSALLRSSGRMNASAPCQEPAWNKWVKRTNDNIRQLLNALKELTEWVKEAGERVRRIENPTISNMVMTYYEHRDEVAKGYERGTKKAQLGNLQYVSKVQVYIEQNNLTSIDDVERIISEKNDILKQVKDGLDNKKGELKRIKKNLSLIDDYYENKPVYEESRKIFLRQSRIVDTAMSQKAVRDKISEIRNRPDEGDVSGEGNNASESSISEDSRPDYSEDEPKISDTADDVQKSEIEENNVPIGDDGEEESEDSDEE